MSKATFELKFQIGSDWLRVSVTDKRGFMGTLRRIRGITAVSADGTDLHIELSGSRNPQVIVQEIRHIYPMTKVQPAPVPPPR